jgi:hypothetical protein
VLQAVGKAMQPDPELHIDVWSEAHVVLPKGTPFPGPYRISHTPYARRIMQCLSPGHPAAVVAAMLASQMLKTQVFINHEVTHWMPLPAPPEVPTTWQDRLAAEPSEDLACLKDLP